MLAPPATIVSKSPLGIVWDVRFTRSSAACKKAKRNDSGVRVLNIYHKKNKYFYSGMYIESFQEFQVYDLFVVQKPAFEQSSSCICKSYIIRVLNDLIYPLYVRFF